MEGTCEYYCASAIVHPVVDRIVMIDAAAAAVVVAEVPNEEHVRGSWIGGEEA